METLSENWFLVLILFLCFGVHLFGHGHHGHGGHGGHGSHDDREDHETAGRGQDAASIRPSSIDSEALKPR